MMAEFCWLVLPDPLLPPLLFPRLPLFPAFPDPLLVPPLELFPPVFVLPELPSVVPLFPFPPVVSLSVPGVLFVP